MSAPRNAVVLTACRLTGDVLNFLLFVLIARLLGPAGAGAYSYGFAVATFTFVVACLGVEEFGLRQYARLDGGQRTAFLGNLLGTQAYMVIVAVFGLALYLMITRPTRATLVLIVALSCYQITAAVAPTLFIPSMARQRMLAPALAELTARVAALSIAAVALGAAHVSLHLAVLGFPIAAVIWLLLAARSMHRHEPATRVASSWPAMRSILTVLWSFALLEIFAQLFARVGVITLSLKISDSAAGVFATGLRLIEVALMPLSFFGVASYPRLSQLFYTDRHQFRHSAVNFLWLLMFGGCAVAWALYFVAPLLLVPVLGERFAGIGPWIQAMAPFALVQAIEVGLGRIMLSADKQAANATFVAVGAVVGLALNLMLVPRFEVYGAISAGIAAYLLVDTLCIGALGQPLYRGTLLRMFLSFVISAMGAALVVPLVARRGLSLWAQALACVVVVAVVGGVGYRGRFNVPGLRWQRMGRC